jgi:K+-sensing histidine kinase KdpD
MTDTSAFVTIKQVLLDNFYHNNTINLVMRSDRLGKARYRYLELQMKNITYEQQEFRVATFHDVTERKKIVEVESNNRIVSLLSSSVSHEMVTPLKCIISFATSLKSDLKHLKRPKKQAELIYVTAKLLLSEVKLLLDNNLI